MKTKFIPTINPANFHRLRRCYKMLRKGIRDSRTFGQPLSLSFSRKILENQERNSARPRHYQPLELL